MEFDANFEENSSFHQSFSMENPSKPQMENGFLMGSSSSNQNFSNFDQFSKFEGSPLNFSFGILDPFDDPFDPFQASLVSDQCANHFHLSESNTFGSNDANHFVHGYSPQILNQEDQNYHPLNYQELGSMNVSYSNEFSSLTMEDKRETKEMETKDDSKEQKEVHPEESSEGHQNTILVKGQWTHDEDK